MNFLFSLSPWIFTLLVIFVTTIVSVGGLLFTRKFLPGYFILLVDISVANIYIRQVGTLLTVLLAFAVISIWNNFELQREHTAIEASTLGNLYRDSRGLRPDAEKEIQELITRYTKDVVEHAWPAMKEGRESIVAWVSFNKLYGKVVRYMPENSRDQIVLSRMLNHLNDLAKYRRLRHIRNANPYIPQILWITIYSGTLLILFSGYFLRTTKMRMQIILTTINGMMFGMLFAMMFMLNYPYRGSLQISSSPLQNLLSDVFPLAQITDVAMEPDTFITGSTLSKKLN